MRIKMMGIMAAILMASFASISGWAANEEKLVVMNPRGVQPEIRKIPMAVRPASLDNKTVYVVDIKYAMTKPFVNEFMSALKAKYPKTTWVLREKLGMYMDDDPTLWKEVKEKAAAAIVLVGH